MPLFAIILVLLFFALRDVTYGVFLTCAEGPLRLSLYAVRVTSSFLYFLILEPS